MSEALPAVVLCGGQGTRMQGSGEARPKVLVEVGDQPMLWHLLKIYAHYGHTRFILCLGYLGDQIRRYFLEYEAMHRDATFRLGAPGDIHFHGPAGELDWEITFAETGTYTQTGARIHKIAPYIETERFFATYGDGLGDVDLDALLEYHKSMGVLATLTGVRPHSQWGRLEIDDGLVTGFQGMGQRRLFRVRARCLRLPARGRRASAGGQTPTEPGPRPATGRV
jgi:glucose-1-phosphate cytidylyltransferase